MNLALSRNVESREPVRVLRGYKLQSAFAPEYGYRYDGNAPFDMCLNNDYLKYPWVQSFFTNLNSNKDSHW